MDSAHHVCPECGQPVDTVVRRHKTLGAWVPVWVAGPCRNPRCKASTAEGAGSGEQRPMTPGTQQDTSGTQQDETGTHRESGAGTSAGNGTVAKKS
ncbi:hypothetical protein [Streptomyces cinereospinus]|uniref:Uncharacterized protein n=1 Tax=Streptomyces cinereospinus TaxID=285561 RepID=A0ABV5MV30_9ACTN